MPDILTPQQRHSNMAAIHGKNTKPEVMVRKWLWSHGYRYRLNHPRLPGKPDIVLPKYKTVIFVNGCFWHMHEGCKYFVWPKSNAEFWRDKIQRNSIRDQENYRQLSEMGWKIIVIWGCQLKKDIRTKTLAEVADRIVNSPSNSFTPER